MNPRALDSLNRSELVAVYLLAREYAAWVEAAAMLRRCGIPNGVAIAQAGVFRHRIERATA